MPEPLSAEREAEIREEIRASYEIANEGSPAYGLAYEDVDTLNLRDSRDLLSAHDYHRAAATRAQAELERVREERDAEQAWRSKAQCELERVTRDYDTCSKAHDAVFNEMGELNVALSALQQRNAALEAELAQARERERDATLGANVRKLVDDGANPLLDYEPHRYLCQAGNNGEFYEGDTLDAAVAAALAGGKEGA